MPIYEYECERCQYQFEALVPMASRDEVACEKCGKAEVHRLVSTFASSGPSAMASMSSGGSCCGSGGSRSRRTLHVLDVRQPQPTGLNDIARAERRLFDLFAVNQNAVPAAKVAAHRDT